MTKTYLLFFVIGLPVISEKSVYEIYIEDNLKAAQYNICIKKLGPEPKMARLVTEGATIRLRCESCIKDGIKTQWTYKNDITGKFLRNIEDGDYEITMLPSKLPLFTTELTIIQAKLTDDNIYRCMTVSNTSEMKYYGEYHVHVIQTEPTIQADRSAPAVQLQSGIYVDFTTGSWSDCIQYGTKGRRYQLNICTVVKISQVKMYPILDEYSDGIPCRSPLLPRQLARKVKGLPSQLVEHSCKVPRSSKSLLLLTRDKNNKTINEDYQELLKKPKFELQKALIGESLTLRCSSKIKSRSIRWQKGAEKLVFGGRLRGGLVDLNGRVQIRNVQQEDRGYYKCWKGDERLVKVIHVIVIEKPPIDPYELIEKWLVLLPPMINALAILLLTLWLFLIRNDTIQKGRSNDSLPPSIN